MTPAQLRRLEKQLRAGYDGYTTLHRAVGNTSSGDQKALERSLENMDRLREELRELAEMAANPPLWLREVKL